MTFNPPAHKHVGDTGKPAQIITPLTPNEHIPSPLEGVAQKKTEPSMKAAARPQRTLVGRLFETFMFGL